MIYIASWSAVTRYRGAKCTSIYRVAQERDTPAYRKRLENYMTELFCSTIYWTHIVIFSAKHFIALCQFCHGVLKVFAVRCNTPVFEPLCMWKLPGMDTRQIPPIRPQRKLTNWEFIAKHSQTHTTRRSCSQSDDVVHRVRYCCPVAVDRSKSCSILVLQTVYTFLHRSVTAVR